MPIFDQGYQHWKGALSGHAWRWLAISRHGIRTQVKGRYVRLLLILAWMPAFALVAALAAWGLFEQGVLGSEVLQVLRAQGITENPQAFRQAIWTLAYSFFFRTELYFILLLVTLTGPNLISLDLRFNALPLYLSRPVTRLDYFLGKLGVIAGLVAAVAVLPAAAAYVLGVCFSLDLTVVRDTWRLLPAGILYGLVIVLSAGTLMLALSSMSRRSLYVGLTWVGLFLIGWVISGVLGKIHQQAAKNNRIYKEQEFSPAQAESHHQGAVRRRWDLPPAAEDREFDSPSWQQVEEDLDKADAQARRTDWRPLFSYTANLDRLGEAILSTDAAWVKIGRVYEQRRVQMESMSSMSSEPWRAYHPQPYDERHLADYWVPQYPWTWSAAVLAGLGVLSLCILSTRVKSLDRLR